MSYNFVADSFHIKKQKCSRLSSSEVRFFAGNGRFAFLSPLLGLRGNVRWSSYAQWKARNGLPISVNWTFFARCYGWGTTGEYQLKIGVLAPTGLAWPKNLR